ncbi:YheC/YheD family protein [Halalkalibacter flavus]|uniref:YheC/YheD family endospore coat-associated protein n=1 Tax=Halalkalibacter flavus TaxID=3090668 RepID=UPI002FC6B1D4
MNFFRALQSQKVKIGVYISIKAMDNLYIKQETKYSIRELVKANNSLNTTLFFFSRKDVNLEQLTINGVYFDNQSHKWIRKEYSYPDVLYSRTREINNKVNMKLRESFIKEGVSFLNSRSAFDKWNVHKELSKDPKVSQHLPVTKLYNHPRDLRKMFAYNRSIYIKPRIGRLGNSIIQVRMVPRQGYEYKYFSKKSKRLVFRKVKTYKKLTRVIRRILRGKSAIMQSAIHSIKYNNRMVDMRAEIQRTGNGELKVMDVFSRIGANNSPITNLPSGAEFFRFGPFTRSYLNYSDEEADLLKRRIEVFLKNIHESIEKVYGPLGETAIDFALDSKQKLWFIECNSTSTKLAYSVANSPQEIISSSFINPLEYSIYLHKQRIATSNNQ